MPKPEQNTTFDSLEELQRAMPGIIERYGGDQQVALGALANPLLALQKAGYSLSPKLHADLDFRIRFGEKKAKRLKELQASIYEAVGKKFDLQSPQDLKRVVGAILKTANSPASTTALAVDIDVRTPQLRWGECTEDPLKRFADLHPVMKPLLEYRQLEASEPRLASPALFEQISNGTLKLPFKGVQFKMTAKADRARPQRPKSS
jgi:hypothetical protein